MTTATETAAPEAATAWQAQIIEQLGQADTDQATHAIITRDGDEAQLVDVADSENAAIIVAEDWTAKRPDDEFTIVKLDELTAWADTSGFADRPAGVDAVDTPEDTTDADIAQSRADAENEQAPDPDTGQLFKVAVDSTQPTLLGLSFSGDIALSREEAEWVDLFNKLKEGKVATLKLGVYVTSSKKTHRRDKDGNVDAVVQTKSIKITDLHIEGN